MLVDGERECTCWEDIDSTDEDFPDCGRAPRRRRDGIGVGQARRISQCGLVDFAVGRFEVNRG